MKKNLVKTLIIVPIVLVAALGALYFYANLETENQLDQYIERVIASGSYQDIQYEDAEFGVNGTITIDGLSVTDNSGFQYTIDQLQITQMDFLNVFPHSINVRAEGFRFPQGIPELRSAMLTPELANYIAMLDGTESIPVAMNYRHEYDPANNDEFSSTVDVSMPNSFVMSFNATTRNIPYESLNQIADPAEAQAMMGNAMFNAEIPQLGFSFTDSGALDAYLQSQASQQGRSADILREELTSMTQSLFLFAPADLQGMAIDLGNELSSFMEGNKTFNLSVQPDFEGSVQQLQTPIMSAFFSGEYAQIADLLNIEFYTE